MSSEPTALLADPAANSGRRTASRRAGVLKGLYRRCVRVNPSFHPTQFAASNAADRGLSAGRVHDYLEIGRGCLSRAIARADQPENKDVNRSSDHETPPHGSKRFSILLWGSTRWSPSDRVDGPDSGVLATDNQVRRADDGETLRVAGVIVLFLGRHLLTLAIFWLMHSRLCNWDDFLGACG